MTSAEIGNYGERYVTNWLEAQGYLCHRNTQLPGSTDIETAEDQTPSLLVQVKTAVAPSSPAWLSDEGKKAIVARANRSQKQAWLAQVSINAYGQQVGEIKWTRLN